ncbi:MAG: MFS transporter [Bacteroidales bacterium]|nr:MFS transporter [Bacteroidales bacterium]
MKQKPNLTFFQLWSMSFGFLGVQIGYSLQNGNASRILSALGAHVETLSYFWLAAPLTGMIIQPLIGHWSDRTWTRFGRRIPFIVGGSILAAASMFFMPNSGSFAHIMPILLFGAIMLVLMDASFNITMQPFRALVGDKVNESQRNAGYAIQSFLINVGAIIGSLLPFFLAKIGVQNVPEEGKTVAPSVIWSFYIGGTILLLSVLFTAFTTKEYKPTKDEALDQDHIHSANKTNWLSIIKEIPSVMIRLGIVQFFSWFALFLMWVYTTPGVAQNVWKTLPNDSVSAAYNDAGNWVGVIFAVYSFFAAIYAIFMARLANRWGRKSVYSLSLLLGGVGLLSMVFIHQPTGLIYSMIGVGIAWAAILAMPYAILSASIPSDKMGVYMGIFNITITVPQIAAGLLGGIILKTLGGKAIMMLGVAGVSMLLAAVMVIMINEKNK